ncbi:acyl-CoA dehydrogenase [Sphingomonas sp.]|uniref:acyl-CoA dehydrogenase n=1 Tax=Sphingomonas sp. TaxID=28214 RepID=UPI003AFF6E2D
MNGPTPPDSFLRALGPLARAWDAANGDEAFPAERLAAVARAGGLTAFTRLPDEHAVRALYAALRRIGGADLSLGRIWEGHVNAAQLVDAYGDAAQRAAVEAGSRVLGVWNTEPAPGMTIAREGDVWRLSGAKSFATGAGHIDAALITARLPDGGKQMVVVDIRDHRERADNAGWRVRGMRGTRSGRFDFDGLVVASEALIGAPGDYEREPRFSAGAWRFAAVQLGAAEALVRHLRDHLVASGKREEPIQRARFAGCVAAVRGAGAWVERAALRAEAGDADAIPLTLMARGVVEEAALGVMEAAARGVGTAAFFEDSRIDRISRDLGLYLRQPVPDQARDRAAAAWLERDRWGDDPWW